MVNIFDRQRKTTVDLVEFASLNDSGLINESDVDAATTFYEELASESGLMWNATAYLAEAEQEIAYTNFDQAFSEAKREGSYIWRV